MPVSIGIPVFNAELYLANAIRSVFAQSYTDWELIIVDDGSSDRSLDVAMSVNDPRVRVISDRTNRRLPYRLNQIVAESKFDLVARMDADDLMSPYRLEQQLAVLLARPEIDLVSTGVCSITNDDLPVGVRVYERDKALTTADMVAGRSGIVHASVLARKGWFLRNPYDERQLLTEDYELWLRAFLRRDLNFVVMKEPYYYYREDGNVTVEKLLRAYKSQRQVIMQLFAEPIDRLNYLPGFYARSLVTYVLSKIGYLDVIRMRRNHGIADDALIQSFSSEIEAIKSTKVPGLDRG